MNLAQPEGLSKCGLLSVGGYLGSEIRFAQKSDLRLPKANAVGPAVNSHAREGVDSTRNS